MSNKGGQEQRAFVAILLAMGVLVVWNFFFAPQPAEQAQPGDQPDMSDVAGLSEGSPSGMSDGAPEPANTGSDWMEAAPDTSSGSAAPSLLGDGAGSQRGVTSGPTQLTAGDPVARQQVTVTGSDIVLELDSRGARVTRAYIPAFEDGEGGPVQLLPADGPGALGSVVVHGGRSFPLDHFDFELVSDQSSSSGRRIVFELSLAELKLRKVFTVPKSGHLLQVEHELLDDRLGLEAWGLSWAGGMRVTERLLGSSRGAYFNGVVMAEGSVQRKDPSKARNEPIEFPGTTRFVGIQNKYFMGAIVPRGDQQGPARLWRVAAGTDEKASLAGEILVNRPPGLAAELVAYDVFIGPLDYPYLKALGLGLEGSVDLGARWIRPLSRTILSIIIAMHRVIPNYGVVIVLFALAMNALFLPLTWKSTKSMRDMSALKPRLDALKEKHKDEPQKMSEATMKLYKEAGVNPLAGCLPLLIQMPIFFSLYAVLIRTIELRQEPFVFWIRDLSQPDVIFNLPFSLPMIGSGVCLLPIIMGVSSYFQSKQTMVDPNQRAMLIMMPIMMTVIFFTMPSGLVLYWLTSNLFTIGSKYFMKPSKVAEAMAEESEPESGKPRKKGGGGSRPAKRPAKAGAKS